MKTKLIVVESPAKAGTISKFLGKGYKVVASNGHIRDLPKSQLGVDVDDNFKPKYITIRGRGDILDKIKKDAKAADLIYLATDPDREGEAISWHIANVLKMDEKTKRITFNEITSTAVKKAIANPREINQNVVDAQQARRILDRLVGYKLSPILWAKVRKGLSAGRVQSVATRLICDREQEINDFVPKEYWLLNAMLKHKDGKKPFEAKFHGKGGKKLELNNEQELQEVLSAIEKAKYIVSEYKVGERVRHAQPPFTTSNLQQEASRKLGFTTKRTMLIAQQLYEGVNVKGRGAIGLVTYIRTDSVRVSAEAQQAALKHIEDVYGKEYAPAKPNFYKGRKSSQDAHEAIRPTYLELTPASVKESLSRDQLRLYQLIYNRFLASQMASAIYETQAATLDANGYTFRATGIKPKFLGYTVVYTESTDNGDDEKYVTLPIMEKGDECKLEKLLHEQKFTQPPPRYSEAMLVKTLEEKGIGRPSTYAPIISTIIDRRYVTRKSKILYPTDLGIIVTQLMKENFAQIVDVGFTATMEEDLDEVEEGNKKWEEIIGEFYGPFQTLVEKAEKDIEHIEIPDEVSDVKCEKCGAMMVYKDGRFGRFLACPNYPECKNTKAIVEHINVPCPKCGAELLKRRSKKGRTFFGCEKYPECDFVSWDQPIKEKCPECGSYMVQKNARGKQSKACSNKECGYKEETE
ncbi:type I DNA topoisomerase [Clostridia bacterium OttesenSCG-928-F22]|nr:type I DNA topoisomerase [Clostridia bacterium OttesenSCG-928-F22]